MKFRIVEYKKYDIVYYYIQQYYNHFFGIWKGWTNLTRYECGDEMYPGSQELIKFNSAKEAEEHLKRIYSKAYETVVITIEIWQ